MKNKTTTLLLLTSLTSLTICNAQVPLSDLQTSDGATLTSSSNDTGIEIGSFYVAEVFLESSGPEIKEGFGLRGRYYLPDGYGFGLEGEGFSLTPRDSIMDRANVGLVWKKDLTPRIGIVLSGGHGWNIEDRYHGPVGGVGIQHRITERIFGELNGKFCKELEDGEDKLLLTLGVGYEF